MQTMTKENERQLIENILNGDAGAFELLVKQHERLVAHMVYRLIDQADDRLDICQDAFIKVYTALPHFRFDCKLSTWIAKIAYRTALNALEKKRAYLYEDVQGGQSLDELPGAFDGPEVIMEASDRKEHLEKALRQLDERYRIPLTLYHLESMSYTEIAEIMALPEGTVKSHLFRARKQLKEVLLQEVAGETL
jgi:RNA polymerase sigma-70 factor (ECF subfamily)